MSFSITSFHSDPPTCRHYASGGDRHHRDVLRGMSWVEMSSHSGHLWSSCSTYTSSFLLGHPGTGSSVHGGMARHREHGSGVVCGRRVGEGDALFWPQLLLHLVQKHGVLDLKTGNIDSWTGWKMEGKEWSG